MDLAADFLVTGGMGFIGRHTIAALKATYPDARIICLDNLSTSEETHLGSRVEFVKGDVTDFSLVTYLVERCHKSVIHLAADSRVLPSVGNPQLVVGSTRTNVVGTANVLAAMAKSPHLPSLVYAGSSTAYGEHVPQTETDLPSIQSPYAATKLAGELLVRSFAVTFGIQATVLRYFQVYGPGQPTTGAYALVTGVFLRQLASGEPLTIEGGGSQTRDFVHVRDVARANVLAIDVDSEGLPVNIGSGVSHSIQELADIVSPNQVYLPPRRVDLKATHADIARAGELLGWKPSISLQDGMTEMTEAVLRLPSKRDYSPGPYIPGSPDPRDDCHRGRCYPLLRHCVDLCEPGFGLEFGVQTGHSLLLISRQLTAVGFDSFEGLPEPWGEYPQGTFAQDPPDVDGELVIGWFADTLPGFDFSTIQPLRLVHIDCDLYSSTTTVLEHLGPYLKPGCIVVFDEAYGLDGEENDELRAWRDYVEDSDINWIVIGNEGRSWAIRIV